jgi:asparagine synthase (glutamine-hydrolysing)
MCGIAGILMKGSGTSPASADLQHVEAALQHRGPDNQSHFRDDRCALIHARLSILDPSPASHQPMQDQYGNVLVFNGEIYNFKSLRKELIELGCQFETDGDTEVLLAAYRTWDSDCLQKLNGFFAFAIYNQKTQDLFVARDRIGIKPLYFHEGESFFAFASNMKALYALGIPRDLDHNSIHHYLQLNYFPGKWTVYQNVQQVRPGEYISISKDKVERKKWYDIPEPENKDSQISTLTYSEKQSRLLDVLEDAVRLRLVSDVPLGAFLSGGIDSSVIVALASRHVPSLKTFSIGYRDEAHFDETEYANLVAEKYQTDHHVFSLSNDDLFEHLHDMLDQLDEPFADSSALAVYILSKKTREHVTVALSGDGADELFAGYHKYMGEFRMLDKSWKGEAVAALAPLWSGLPKSRNSFLSNRVRQLDRFSKGYKLSASDRYWRWAALASTEEVAELLQTDYQFDQAEELRRRISLSSPAEKGLEGVLLADQRMVLVGDMLRKADTMSMANGLELRVPFLDHRVVEFASSLSVSDRINGQYKKRILQDAARNLLPEQLYQRKKQGFEVPLLNWFRGPLQSYIFDDLFSRSFMKEQGLFNYEAIKSIQEQLMSRNPGEAVARIWALLVFQNWWKKFHLA